MGLQRMYPKSAHLCSFPFGQGAGTHTGINVWTYSDAAECAPSVDEDYGALDETNYSVARSRDPGVGKNNGRFEWIFGDPPTNVVIASLTLVGWFRTSSGNAAAIDTPPTVQFFVNIGGTRYYAPSTDTIDRPINRATMAPAGTFAKWTRTWVVNPATAAAWTRTDLLSGTIKAGISSNNVNGSGIYPTTGGTGASFDVASFYIELDTTPTGLYIDPVRRAISHQLRMVRRALRTFTVEVPPEFCMVEPGQTVWASHDLLPWSPGNLSWQQVPLFVLQVEERLSQRRRRITFLDLRDQYASFWSPLRVTGVDAQNSGLAMVHRGGGWATTRAQVAYARRPGDGLYQQVAANAPVLTWIGLLIQGGGDINYLLNSTFSQGAGAAFTSWTTGSGGTGSVAEDTSDYLIDSPGWQRSAKCLAPGVGDTAWLSQTIGSLAANTKVFVRLHYKDDSGALLWRLTRAVDGWYWNNATPGWQAGAVLNALPTSSTIRFNEVSQRIDVGGSNTTLTLTVGYLFAVGAAATAHVYSAEITLGTYASWKGRSILPTTNATVTRVKDICLLDNSEDFRILSGERGYMAFDFTPQWSHADLANDEAIGLGQHAIRGYVAVGFPLYYYRTDAGTGFWAFGDAIFPTSGATLPAAGTTYRIAGRFTSTAEGELGLVPQAKDIWVNGVKGNGTTGAVELAQDPQAHISLGCMWIVPPDPTLFAEGTFKNLVTDSRCPTDAEMERM